MANKLLTAPEHDIFISYAEVDREWVENLAKELEKRKMSVSLERAFISGKSADLRIESELTSAKCVIVVWSHESVSSEFVLAEAHVALERDIVIPVLKENVKLPFAFRRINTANLMDWDGDAHDRQFIHLVASVERLLGRPSSLDLKPTRDIKPEPTLETVSPSVGRIFFSYDKKDTDIAQSLANALERRGFEVWWDRSISVGKSWDSEIEEALEKSDCVLVIWSEDSVQSNWVRAEAGEGFSREILIPVIIDNSVTPPLMFRRLESANLDGWKGYLDDPRLIKLAADITNMLKKSER